MVNGQVKRAFRYRFHPSEAQALGLSRTSGCVRKVYNLAMPLRIRTWTCACGTTYDRDVNAARDILAAGPAVTVCGADVRPQRNTPGGRTVTKQKTLRRELWDSPSFTRGKKSTLRY